MKLLLFTQALDRKDPVLSAYHRLVLEISKHFEKVTVVCLKKGDYEMPTNVKVLSLGKEDGASRFKYICRFYRYIFSERYDSVFVHMNQEYILLGGIFWRLMGKKVYMWRNHHAGSFFTDIAAFFCDKVFCTSRFSYTSKYRKTILMPVGIDTSFFAPDPGANRISGSILFLARMAPVKKPHVLVDALGLLKSRGAEFSASFYGDPLPADEDYYESLKDRSAKLGLSDRVRFHNGVSNEKTVGVYSAYDLFVNLSSSGMYDKTIFEAMACETLSLCTNRNLEGSVDGAFLAKEDDVADIASKLEAILEMNESQKIAARKDQRALVEREHSLSLLGKKLSNEIQ